MMLMLMLAAAVLCYNVADAKDEVPNHTLCTHSSEFDDYPWSAVEINDPDAARGKPAYASSTNGYTNSHLPSIAVDGDPSNGYYHSNTVVVNHWWAVDLGETMTIKEVAITSYRSHNKYNIRDFMIGLMDTKPPANLDTGAYRLCHKHVGETIGGRKVYACKPNTAGRFLVVHMPPHIQDRMILREVNVYTCLNNDTCSHEYRCLEDDECADIQKGKSAFSSSTSSSSHAPNKALDGKADSYFHTKEVDTNPWWAVDLGARMNINAVVITNYPGHWLHDFLIGVMDTAPPALLFPGAYKLCNKHVGEVKPGATFLFRCQKNIRGRYVVIHMTRRRGKLILPEVIVSVYPDQKGNIAVGRPVWESSLYKNVDNAAVAVNGDRSNNGTMNQCSQTRMEVDPWWAVDLGMTCPIRQVIITSRADCCVYRLSNFVIGITNENPLETHPRPGMYGVCKFHVGPVGLGSSTTLKCDAILQGRYLIIQIPGQDKVLELCEVEVYTYR